VHLCDAPGEQGADGVLGVLAPGGPRLGFGGLAGICFCEDQLYGLLQPGGIGRAVGVATVAERGGDGPALVATGRRRPSTPPMTG
jgi:hypothetical protein